MNAKQQTAEILENSGKEYVSGSVIAERLGITRAAVWKCIKQMEEEGYEIESTKKGYRLGDKSDALSRSLILKYLGEDASYYNIEVFDVIDSTNTYLKRKAPEYLSGITEGRALQQDGKKPEWYAVIADRQDLGRGRMGRSFVSPAGSGIYLSVLFKPQLSAQQAVSMTTAAAVAACRAIEECTDSKPQIKWVNDIFIDGKKTCGILTEASVDLEGGGLDWAVIGIGFNVYMPEGGFPEEIKDIAGSIVKERSRDLRSRIAALFLKELHAICRDLKASDFAKEYKNRCFLIGKNINVIKDGEMIPAVAYDLDDELHLLVRYENGRTEALNSGEVSVREKK